MRSVFESAGRSASDRERLSTRARSELDLTSNPFVLAAAATALPNLFVRTQAARNPAGDRSAFEYSSTLMARARQLGAGQQELSGPMPLIRDFEQFTSSPSDSAGQWVVRSGGPPNGDPQASGTGVASVRIGGSVMAAKLIEKPEPVYPEPARQARIQGVVRFNAIVSAEGSIENATLVSGHPLFVVAAQEALRRYRYQPTLLNGVPVGVITQVDVPFKLE